MLASWTPPFLHLWRRMLLRIFGAKIASTAGIYSSARIWSPANLEMDEFAWVGPRVQVYSMAPTTFASYSLGSLRAHLCAGTHDVEDINFQLQARPIRIGSHAWIAAEAFVGPGVVVGDGAIPGARGCPVIASANTGAADLFTDGREWVIAPIRNSYAICDCSVRLADEPALRARISAAAIERLKEIDGWSA